MSTADRKRHWFVAGILLLSCALAVLAVSAWYSLQLRAHQGRVTGLALTLTRIASHTAELAADQAAKEPANANPKSVFQGDQLAQLIATGDIQAAAIENTSASLSVNRVTKEYPQVVSHWQQVRREFGKLNRQAIEPVAKGDASLNEIESVQQSFELLFDAIINESLSRPLLKSASTLRGDISSLRYVIENNTSMASVQSLVDQLQLSTVELKSIATPDSGPALLGYTTALQLGDFLTMVERLQVFAPAAALSVSSDTGSLSEVSSAALSYIQNALRFVDTELHRSRRNLLVALSLACLGILLITALTWFSRKTASTSQVKSRQTLDVLVDDISRIANGNLGQRSKLVQVDQANQPIAELVDYTTSMVDGLVSVSRGVAHKTTELASMQQAAIEDMATRAEVSVEHNAAQLDELSAALTALQQSVERSASPSATGQHNAAEIQTELDASVTGAASSLAGLSAQLDMGVGRIERALHVSDALMSVIGKMENTSQQSNLQALNASIKHAGYYDNDDDTESFIQNSQRVSRQLQTECNTAIQQAQEVRADLEACAASLRECLSLLEQSARHSLQSTQSLKKLQLPATNGTAAAVAEQVVKLRAIAQVLGNTNNSIGADESLLLLKGHALELQLMAAKLDESMLRFELSELPADEQ